MGHKNARMLYAHYREVVKKFRRYHRLLDDLSVRRWQSSKLRGVIDWKWRIWNLSLKDGRGCPSFDQRAWLQPEFYMILLSCEDDHY